VRWIAWLVLAGCGRIGLDPLADGAAVRPPDATADAIAPVVCTDGTCASSSADFAEIQGENGWWYGAWDISDDADGIYEPSDFQPDAVFSGLWRPPDWAPDPDPHFTWAYLAAWGGHPGSYPIQRADVRRWVSTVAGAAVARVSHRKADTSGGDGTRAMLVVDGALVFTRDVAGDDGVGFVQDVPVSLHVGSTVELLLHCIGDDAIDTTEQSLEIVAP
jgi:hypothetical protein